MEIIHGNRQTGKTTKLVKYALENNSTYIITANKICTVLAKDIMRKLCYENPEYVIPASKIIIVDINEYCSNYIRHIRNTDKLVIDEAGEVLRCLLTKYNGEVKAFSVTTNDCLEEEIKNE